MGSHTGVSTYQNTSHGTLRCVHFTLSEFFLKNKPVWSPTSGMHAKVFGVECADVRNSL